MLVKPVISIFLIFLRVETNDEGLLRVYFFVNFQESFHIRCISYIR